MKIRLAVPLQYDSIVDGEGVRTVLWTQGCPHKCPGCHNEHTQSFKSGFLADTQDLKEELILGLKYQDGITLSGGEPFMQPEAVYEIASFVKQLGKNVWAYSGFTFEELLEKSENDENVKKLLNQIDILIDGKFVLEQKSMDLYYKGSINQRVIDVPASLTFKEAITIPEYEGFRTSENLREDSDYIFV